MTGHCNLRAGSHQQQYLFWGEKKRVSQSCRRSLSLMDHIIHRALVKIPSDVICIIESIRDMSVDITCRKRPGAEEDLCMPVILQLLLACLSPPMYQAKQYSVFWAAWSTTLENNSLLRSCKQSNCSKLVLFFFPSLIL